MFTRFNRQLCFSLSLFLLLTSFQLVPFVRSLPAYLVVQSIFGYSMASIDVASNAWVIEIWPENPNPFMQGLHFSFAIGTSLASPHCRSFPSILQQFRSKRHTVSARTGGISCLCTIHHCIKCHIRCSIITNTCVYIQTIQTGEEANNHQFGITEDIRFRFIQLWVQRTSESWNESI